MSSQYKKLLLVEDDKDDQDIFIELLSQIDASVACSTASNSLEALQSLVAPQSERPGLIFLDLNMPKADGFDFMLAMRNDPRYASFRDIPIIILTTAMMDWQRCFNLGATLCYTKPSTVKGFRKMLSTLLSSDVVKEKATLQQVLN